MKTLTRQETQERLLNTYEMIDAHDLAVFMGAIDRFFDDAKTYKLTFPDDCDESGRLVWDSLTPDTCPKTLDDMMGKYTGVSVPTFCPGMGLEWITYYDYIADAAFCLSSLFSDDEEPDEAVLMEWSIGSIYWDDSNVWLEAECYFDEKRQLWLDNYQPAQSESDENEEEE